MNEILNKFLFAGDKFMQEMHLQQPGLTYNACGSFAKSKERMKSLCRQEIQVLFVKMNLIKLAFSMICLW